jgi:hypothetical protein
MSWSAPIKLRPFATDLAVSHACRRIANPTLEQPLRVITWLADEKIMAAAAAVFWAATRVSASRPFRREADQMLCSLSIAGVVPHLCKYLVCRERPNCALVRRFDTRVARRCLGLVSIRPCRAFKRHCGVGAPAGAATLVADAHRRVRRAGRQPRRAACALSERRCCRLGHRRAHQ